MVGCDVSLMRHPLSEVCRALTASTTMRMAWMTIRALSIMMFVSRVRLGDVHRARHERRELLLRLRVRSVDDCSELWRSIRRQL
jgi:hypothetical protein